MRSVQQIDQAGNNESWPIKLVKGGIRHKIYLLMKALLPNKFALAIVISDYIDQYSDCSVQQIGILFVLFEGEKQCANVYGRVMQESDSRC